MDMVGEHKGRKGVHEADNVKNGAIALTYFVVALCPDKLRDAKSFSFVKVRRYISKFLHRDYEWSDKRY